MEHQTTASVSETREPVAGGKDRKQRIRRMTATAMVAALAYLMVIVCKIPVVMFLKYDPKDVMIAVGGFMLGPLSAVYITVAVALIEMVTVGASGLVGFLMNVISSCAFTLPAAWLYARRRNLRGAVLGLTLGAISMTGMMLVWNLIVTPLYMGYPRQAVVDLILPVLLPFNLCKSVLNAGLIMLMYKRISGLILRMAGRYSPSADKSEPQGPSVRLLTVALSAAMVLLAVGCMWLLSRG